MGLAVYIGVKGGVMGRFIRFAAVAPSRWRGVRLAFMVVFGAGTLLLMARGILEGLAVDEDGVGKPCERP